MSHALREAEQLAGREHFAASQLEQIGLDDAAQILFAESKERERLVTIYRRQDDIAYHNQKNK